MRVHACIDRMEDVWVCTCACSGCAALVDSWKALGPALSSIVVLDLSKNAIGSAGAALLADGLQAARFPLIELSLEDVDMRDTGLAALVAVCACIPISVLVPCSRCVVCTIHVSLSNRFSV